MRADKHRYPLFTARWPGWGRWLARIGLPFLVLNAMLGMENLWPTLWPHPAARLSFELCMAMLALTGWIALSGGNGRWLVRPLAFVTAVWVVSRYAEVTSSAVFGRQINLYWDGRHLLDVLHMGQAAWWQIAAGAAALAAAAWLIYRVSRACWGVLARELAWREPRAVIGIAGAALLASFAAQGIGGRDTRWFFSMPVAPIIAGQTRLLAAQLLPGQVAKELSPSPTFAANLHGLDGADVLLVFAESYGACTLDDPAQAAWLAPHREQLARALAAGGRQAVSARVRSPTFGGASWLAHAALLSGVDTRDPGDYELLLATDRPTLVRHFKTNGYRTVNWMPGLQKPWPEGSFYGFDRYADADTIGYRGPPFGHWRIPDQASMALMNAQELAAPQGSRAPRLIVFPTLASHAPFRPIAPYVADWGRLTGADAYTAADVARAAAQPVSWLEPVPAYLQSLAYTFEWLGDYLSTQAPRKLVTIVIGDHQPMASVSGSHASWDVPVHVISDDPALLRRLEARGFTEGLIPGGAALGPMQALTPLLLDAFDGPVESAAGAAE